MAIRNHRHRHRNHVPRTKPDNGTITYVYDAVGRILEKHYPDNTTETYSYDQNGNMITAANQNIGYAFTYDVNNRLTGVTDSFYRTVTCQYDAAGNRTSMTSPEGLTTTYTYNDAGRLTGTGNFAGNFTLTYDAAGRRTQLAYPNGTTAAYTYDANGNLTLIRHANSGDITLAATSYTYNSINNRITRNTAGYTYDAVSRLTYSTAGESYTYDGVGNRLTGPNTTDTMSYNAGNEQQNINATQFTYDANGNRIQKTEGGVTTTYTYDDENRLVQVVRGADTIIYAYDPLGRRIAKSVNNVVTWYVYDGNAILAAYDLSGAVTARYAHGLNIDEPLAVQQGSATSFYHADGLGSIVALTNVAGSVVQTYSYDSFGNITPSGGINQPYTYTAREYDSETGLYFYRARYYDPKAGRFVSRDPIGFGGGDVNLFAYVKNNPINYTDPEGLFAIAIPPILIYGPPLIAIAYKIITDIAKNPPKSPSKCEDNDKDNACEQMYQIDTSTCNGITKVRGSRAGARCHASASQRYAECLRAGGPGGVRTPLDTWNN